MRPDELYHHMIEFANQFAGFTIVDQDGYYLYVSEPWSKAMGYTLEELKGIRVWEVFPDTEAKTALETGRQVIAHPVKWGKDQIAGFTNYYPFFAPDGTVCGCYCLVILEGLDNARILQNQIAELSSKLEFLQSELSKKNNAHYHIDQIIGHSPQILEMKTQIRKAAHSNSTVLIEGETGTGKELVARAIHQLSKRSKENFVGINCAAIPPELMEAEFFGYEKGAFTGADPRGKAGKFVAANGGTVFLDEINSLPLYVQPKFLRVLQEREVEPIGSTTKTPINIKVIAASNVPLINLVSDGEFRRDLYYRLNVIRIVLPSLRERKEDIPELVNALLMRLNQSLGTHAQSISPSALKLLMDYDWPGNVRELQNALESAINMAESSILRRDDFYELSNRIRAKEYKKLFQKNPYDLQTAKMEFEKAFILDVLESYQNNHTKAAQKLGISRTMLYKKLAQYKNAPSQLV